MLSDPEDPRELRSKVKVRRERSCKSLATRFVCPAGVNSSDPYRSAFRGGSAEANSSLPSVLDFAFGWGKPSDAIDDRATLPTKGRELIVGRVSEGYEDLVYVRGRVNTSRTCVAGKLPEIGLNVMLTKAGPPFTLTELGVPTSVYPVLAPTL